MSLTNKLLTLLVGSVLCNTVLAYDFTTYNAGFVASDYREALNMGLKFFGGQRCGNNKNWMLVENENVNKKFCHTMDGQGSINGGADGNYDLTGGWHDCGDHIKVAVTMGSSATFLLATYDIWPDAFQDNYDAAYGAPNGIPDILDEAKIATDYFIKSFIDDNTFVYYIGCPGDHNVWMTSSRQSDQTIENGGDPRPVWTSTTKGGPQAANYASALALMAIHYPDETYREKCKIYAVKAYNYAVKNKSTHAPIEQFYPSPNTEWTDELSLAAILLYRITNDSQYLNQAISYLQGKWESNSPIAWDTMSDFAYYYITKADATANNGSGGTFASFLEKNVYKLHLPKAESDVNGFPYYTNTWGTNKLACGGATAAALYLKLVDDGVITSSENTEKAKNFNQRIVDYVLGKNEFNHTFLHGYKGDMTYRIHHRNAMGRNDNPTTNVKNTCDYMFASGGMLGGPSSTGVFSNIVEGGSSYTETEGGCDYNAAFIAAIASVVAEKDPVSTTECTPTLSNHSFLVYPTNFDDYFIIDMIERDYSNKAIAELYTIDGRLVMTTDLTNRISTIIETSEIRSGCYILKVIANGQSVNYKLFKK